MARIMAAEIVPVDDPHVIPEDSSIELEPRQVAALDKLYGLGAQPRQAGDRYDKDPQVRALQMVYEGRIGGPTTGAGRPARASRAAQGLSQYIQEKLQPKLKKALDRALDEEAGVKANLDAIRLAMDIENKEAKLQLDEDTRDVDDQSKDELLATLFALVADARTEAVIQATFTEEAIPEAEIVSEEARSSRPSTPAPVATAHRSQRDPARPSSTRSNTRGVGDDGRASSAGDRKAHPNPFTEIALRRAAERRRATSMGKDQSRG